MIDTGLLTLLAACALGLLLLGVMLWREAKLDAAQRRRYEQWLRGENAKGDE